MAAPGPVRSSVNTKADWETPWPLFRAIDREFRFTLDAAASDTNHKVDRYWTEEDDALKCQPAHEVIWCNPPYGRGLFDWVQAFGQWRTDGDCTVVALLPANTDTEWFGWVWATATEIRFLKGRVNFVGSTKGGNTGGSMLAIYRPRPDSLYARYPAVSLWNWQDAIARAECERGE